MVVRVPSSKKIPATQPGTKKGPQDLAGCTLSSRSLFVAWCVSSKSHEGGMSSNCLDGQKHQSKESLRIFSWPKNPSSQFAPPTEGLMVALPPHSEEIPGLVLVIAFSHEKQ